MALLDAATEKHLDAWLQREFNEDERPEKKAGMLRIFAEDPERWADRGWPAVRDEARNRPPAPKPSGVAAERESVPATTRAQQSIDSFRKWYLSAGHWVYASRQEALDKWVTHGIEGLPKAPSEARALLSAWAGLGSTPGPARGERTALPPGKARCSICGKVGSKAALKKHEATCKTSAGTERRRGFDVIRADVSLHERIARALGWSLAETQSVPYPGLRDLVRPVSAALAEEISEVLNLGGHVKRPRPSAPAGDTSVGWGNPYLIENNTMRRVARVNYSDGSFAILEVLTSNSAPEGAAEWSVYLEHADRYLQPKRLGSGKTASSKAARDAAEAVTP